MTSNQTALKPCPRCGNRAFVVGGYEIWCVTDSCLKLPPSQTTSEAIERWNTRSDRTAVLEEALTEAVGVLETLKSYFERDPPTLSGMAVVHLIGEAQAKYRAALNRETGQ